MEDMLWFVTKNLIAFGSCNWCLRFQGHLRITFRNRLTKSKLMICFCRRFCLESVYFLYSLIYLISSLGPCHLDCFVLEYPVPPWVTFTARIRVFIVYKKSNLHENDSATFISVIFIVNFIKKMFHYWFCFQFWCKVWSWTGFTVNFVIPFIALMVMNILILR